MEFYVLTVLVLAASSPGVLGVCDLQSAMSECMTHIATISTLSQQLMDDPSKMDEFCRYVTEFSECTQKYLSGCDPNQMQGISAAMSQMEQFTSTCNKDNPCSLQKLQECTKDMPQSETMPKDEAEVKRMCMKVPEVKMCLEKIKPHCTNSPQINQGIDQAMGYFAQAEPVCKKYSTGDSGSSGSGSNQEGGSTGDNKDDGNSADRVWSFSLLALVMSIFAARMVM